MRNLGPVALPPMNAAREIGSGLEGVDDPELAEEIVDLMFGAWTLWEGEDEGLPAESEGRFRVSVAVEKV